MGKIDGFLSSDSSYSDKASPRVSNKDGSKKNSYKNPPVMIEDV